jgi:hypothetical protein
MTAKQANELATAMLSRIPLVEAGADDPRVLSGELVPDQQLHKTLSRKLRRMFNELERVLCRETPYECEGKSQDEIANILGRAIDAVMSFEMDMMDFL